MPAPDGRSAAQARAAIAAALGQTGFTLPGSITIRRTRCGKPRCACTADPPALHGPYIQWTRTVHGKTVTRLLTPAQHQAYAPWFANTRRLCALAAELEALSLAEMARAEGWATITPGTPAPPRTRPVRGPNPNYPRPPKTPGDQPLNPGTALRRTPVTAGHQSSVVGPLVYAGQGPFPMGEGLWRNRACDHSGAGAVGQGPAGETGWHVGRQRRIRWTLSPAISGRFSQK